MSIAIAVTAFAAGLWLLVESVEGLVKALSQWALAASMSGVVMGALVLGLDVESTAAGVAASLDDLPGTALGTSVGAAIFLMTAGLGIAGLVAPFAVRPPAALMAAGGAATALCLAVAADGVLTRVDGAVLLAGFGPLVAAVVLGAPGRGTATGARPGHGGPGTPPARPAAEARPPCPPRPPRLALRVLGGLAGLVIGAELLVFGTERIVDDLGLSETVFGLLVVAAAVSFEEVVLEALPALRGFPELSVGNALGTLVFLLTGSLGVIVLARPIDVPGSVTSYHLPALAVSVLLAGGLLARGRVGRREGGLLVGSYLAYVAGALPA